MVEIKSFRVIFYTYSIQFSVRIAVTGRPGIGKTTLCLKVYEKLKEKRTICGFITKEVRRERVRVGFIMIDLKTGEEAWLARVGSGKAKVGKYAVFIENIDRFSEKLEDCRSDLIIIDEIGPMELKSRKFVETVNDLLNYCNNILVTVHYKSRHWLVEKIKREFKLYVIDEKNRNDVVEEIVSAYDC